MFISQKFSSCYKYLFASDKKHLPGLTLSPKFKVITKAYAQNYNKNEKLVP